MLIAGGRSSVAWATTKALVRRRDTVLGTHTRRQRPPDAASVRSLMRGPRVHRTDIKATAVDAVAFTPKI